MIGKNLYLSEIDPETYYQPIRFKMLVRLPRDTWDSPIIRPDTLKKGDTTKIATVAYISRVGDLVEVYNSDFKVGTRVVIDPSIDIMSRARAFTWQGEHYCFCDSSDVIAYDIVEA